MTDRNDALRREADEAACERYSAMLAHHEAFVRGYLAGHAKGRESNLALLERCRDRLDWALDEYQCEFLSLDDSVKGPKEYEEGRSLLADIDRLLAAGRGSDDEEA